MFRKYISTKFHVYLDSEAVWEAIELGKNVDDLYPEAFKTELTIPNNNLIMEGLVFDDEKWELMESTNYDYAVTSFGRYFACQSQAQLKVYAMKDDISITIRGIKQHTSDVFNQYGWVFDMTKIMKHYTENKWELNSKP